MEEYKTREAFEWSSAWPKLKYEFVFQQGIEVISAISGSKNEPYEPMKCKPLNKNPEKPEDQNVWSPGSALARMDTNNRDSILQFVNKWGLLGLWRVKRFQLLEDGVFKYFPYRSTIDRLDGEKYSAWYINCDIKLSQKKYIWQEPLPVFIAAVKEYQNIFYKSMGLTGMEPPGQVTKDKKALFYEEWDIDILNFNDESVDDNIFEPDEDESINLSVDIAEGNNYILAIQINDCLRQVRPSTYWDQKKKEWTPGWEFASLLDAIYLQLFLDLQAGRYWRRCKKKNCGKPFRAINPKAEHCSILCSKSQSKTDSREAQWINNLEDQYPYKDRTWIEKTAQLLLQERGVGEKKLKIRMEQIIKEDI